MEYDRALYVTLNPNESNELRPIRFEILFVKRWRVPGYQHETS